jgi:hypothetical protein
MGLNQQSNEKRIYLTINGGNLVKRVPEGTEGAVEREIEFEGAKRMIWEMRYRSLSAMIKNIEVKEGGKFGDVLLVNMQDVDEHFTISLNMKGREAKGFMLCLPNIDLSKEVVLSAYNYVRKKDEKHLVGLGIKQGGDDNVPYFYNTENGLPSSTLPKGEKMDKDEFKLLMAQQDIFLKKATKKFIEEKMLPESRPDKIQPNVKEADNDFPSDEPSDDLPF